MPGSHKGTAVSKKFHDSHRKDSVDLTPQQIYQSHINMTTGRAQAAAKKPHMARGKGYYQDMKNLRETGFGVVEEELASAAKARGNKRGKGGKK